MAREMNMLQETARILPKHTHTHRVSRKSKWKKLISDDDEEHFLTPQRSLLNERQRWRGTFKKKNIMRFFPKATE